MQAVISEQGCVSILALSGRMDATTASVFDEACRSLLDGGAKKIVVDLAGIEYISSAGLRVILTMVKVAEVFKISGFSSMLPIYATRDEAVSALS